MSEIGRGGMGVVYHAVQRSLDRPVALKVLPHSAHPNGTSQERFRREATIAAQLHHTNIVPVFGTGRAGDLHYFAMQFIDGESLDRVLDAARELEPHLDEAYRWKAPPAADGDCYHAAARRLLEGRLAACGAERRCRYRRRVRQLDDRRRRRWIAVVRVRQRSNARLLRGGRPHRFSSSNGACAFARPRHPASRHQTFEPDSGSQRHGLGHRFWTGTPGRSGRSHFGRRPGWHVALSWRPNAFAA